ncbi:CvpA family protein [candidate division KSB1 bacterium]|nr:CvpA family protein [candidate division KSB1 bacterium]NIR68613.1 CvpA family protein [candidate division KSB1 bacterium]NIS24117.1 CvpA family protein [candidate division KSB1 bacterium]NIT71034.1 CvpA family protein [candidate division KSB1 bacterium]NIU24736.1 CvpA family protein [candidate division KSB1 bacterium]
MNYLDIIVVIFVGLFLIKGLIRGFFHEVLGLVGLLVALVLATKHMGLVATGINKVLSIPPALATTLGFLVIFFGVVMFFQLLIHFFQKLMRYSHLGWVEKTAGSLVGFLKGATIISLIFLLASVLPFGNSLIPHTDESKLYEPVRRFAPDVFNSIMKLIPNSKSFYTELKESVDKLSSSAVSNSADNYMKSLQGNNQAPEEPSDKDDKPR